MIFCVSLVFKMVFFDHKVANWGDLAFVDVNYLCFVS